MNNTIETKPNYTEDIIENIMQPDVCYKIIRLYDDGTGESKTYPHAFEDKGVVKSKSNVEVHKVVCSKCGYESTTEWEIEDEDSTSEDGIDAVIPTTPFSFIYDMFLSKITDDMYMELTELDTYRMLEELLLSAMHKFEFPRFDITNYEPAYISDEGTYQGVESGNQPVKALSYSGGGWYTELTPEEVNIIATYMIVEWLGQQLASIENTRMKYSGSDFKFTSQANHMAKVLSMKKDYEREGFHLQRLYKRRLRDENGIMRSTFDTIMEETPIGRKGGIRDYGYKRPRRYWEYSYYE